MVTVCRIFSLTDVTFSLPEECITGFIGINGAGKTTTFAYTFRIDEQKSVLQEVPAISNFLVLTWTEMKSRLRPK